MKHIRLITVFFLLIVLVAAWVVYKTLLIKNSATINKSKHKITIDGCFVCYGCGCGYKVDDKDTYVINGDNKTKCIEGLDESINEKISESLREQSSEEDPKIDIYLEGEDYDKFIKCVKEYSKIE